MIYVGAISFFTYYLILLGNTGFHGHLCQETQKLCKNRVKTWDIVNRDLGFSISILYQVNQYVLRTYVCQAHVIAQDTVVNQRDTTWYKLCILVLKRNKFPVSVTHWLERSGMCFAFIFPWKMLRIYFWSIWNMLLKHYVSRRQQRWWIWTCKSCNDWWQERSFLHARSNWEKPTLTNERKEAFTRSGKITLLLSSWERLTIRIGFKVQSFFFFLKIWEESSESITSITIKESPPL